MKFLQIMSVGGSVFMLIAVSAFAQLAAPGPFDLSWYTIDGGGGRSSGGTFTIDATIGQPDAGNTMSGGTFVMTGGFWLGTSKAPCPADINGGGVVNIDDLLAVINGWGMCPPPCPPSCAADTNDDCFINIDDLLSVINGWGSCP